MLMDFDRDSREEFRIAIGEAQAVGSVTVANPLAKSGNAKLLFAILR